MKFHCQYCLDDRRSLGEFKLATEILLYKNSYVKYYFHNQDEFFNKIEAVNVITHIARNMNNIPPFNIEISEGDWIHSLDDQLQSSIYTVLKIDNEHMTFIDSNGLVIEYGIWESVIYFLQRIARQSYLKQLSMTRR